MFRRAVAADRMISIWATNCDCSQLNAPWSLDFTFSREPHERFVGTSIYVARGSSAATCYAVFVLRLSLLA